MAMKITGTAIFAVAALALRGDRLGLALSALAGLVLLVYSVRDLLAPVRLAADPEGVTLVAGFTRRERLRWDQIERVRVDRRRRLGTVAELLEIDTGEALHLFSSYDLGVPPHEAERVLSGIRKP
ncbi:MAG TPA: PH domain-containing protein [Rugosimonospora sp.]|nr:PH domain-containing protein [Rugosimonospora sp.]